MAPSDMEAAPEETSDSSSTPWQALPHIFLAGAVVCTCGPGISGGVCGEVHGGSCAGGRVHGLFVHSQVSRAHPGAICQRHYEEAGPVRWQWGSEFVGPVRWQF